MPNFTFKVNKIKTLPDDMYPGPAHIRIPLVAILKAETQMRSWSSGYDIVAYHVMDLSYKTFLTGCR